MEREGMQGGVHGVQGGVSARGEDMAIPVVSGLAGNGLAIPVR